MNIFTSSSYGRALFAAVLLVLGLTGTHPAVSSVERHPCSVPQALGLRRSACEQWRLVLRGGGRKKEERKTEDEAGSGPEAEALGLGTCATKTAAMKRQPRKRKSAPAALDNGALLPASERGEEGDGAAESDGNGKGPVVTGGLSELGSLLASPSKLLSSGEQFETPVSAVLGVSPAGVGAADTAMVDASREATAADTSEKSAGRKARCKTTGPPTPRKPQTPRKQKDSAASEAATSKPPKKKSPGRTREHPAAEYACREKQAQAQAEKDWEERDWQGPESGVKNADGSPASPWMDQDEVFALPGVSCCPLPACESTLGGPATAEYKGLISFPRTPAPREDEVVTITDPEQMVGIERMKYGLAGYQTGPSPELLRDLKHNGEPGLWNSSDPEEQARTWRPFSELWLPGHETFKYYKDGKYTGELYDQKTREYWARIANIYAPNMVGLPQIFIDDKAERVGTLDWSVIKDRPATALDPLLKSTYWYTPDTGYVSLWRDGLFPHENVPIDEDGNPLCDPWEREKLVLAQAGNNNVTIPSEIDNGGWGVSQIPESEKLVQRRRRALPFATMAVDMIKKKFKGMMRDAESVSAPRMNPSTMLLMILQSSWMEMREEDATTEVIFEWLLDKNAELSLWPQPAWASIGISFDVIAKARTSGFFLGCTDRWKKQTPGYERKGVSQLFETKIIDRDMDTKLGRISSASGNMRYWERTVAE